MKADNLDLLDWDSEDYLARSYDYIFSGRFRARPYNRLSISEVHNVEYDEADDRVHSLWCAWNVVADRADEAYMVSDVWTDRNLRGVVADGDTDLMEAIASAAEAEALESYARHNFFEALLCQDPNYFNGLDVPREEVTALYRHYDAFGNLLYVGISINAIARFASHRRSSHWANDIASMTIKRFPSRSEAEIAEIEAITRERPRHNITHNGSRAANDNAIPQEVGLPSPWMLDDDGWADAKDARKITGHPVNVSGFPQATARRGKVLFWKRSDLLEYADRDAEMAAA